MKEYSKVLDYINSLNGGKIGKSESNLYKELLEYEKSKSKHQQTLTEGSIEFICSDTRPDFGFSTVMRLAADSAFKTKEFAAGKSDFLVSRDGKYALKYSNKSKDEIQITLLTESELNTADMLLYMSDLNKYYISNAEGDFMLSGYSALNISKLNFTAVNYFEKIVITKYNELYSALSYNGYANSEIISISNAIIELRLNCVKAISAAVLFNDNSKDFVNLKNGAIELPVMLLSGKTQVLLY